ncbi:MAG: putative ArsR family transcriptional regulator [Planctomycetota bacterium]|jgi:predicted ArsR family transcriptional regulator
MQLETATRARDKILCHLKMKGPLTSGNLAEILGVTSIAVRQHLQILQDEGDVKFVAKKGKVGRPVHIWSLTEKSNEHFPDNHSLLTTLLVDGIRKNFGEEGLRAVIDQVIVAQSETAKECLDFSGKSFQERVESLVELRNAQGYMAECRPLPDGGIELIENHCPIGVAACDCSAICDSEAQVFRAVLGEHVLVERRDHMLSGDRRCTYELHEQAVSASESDEDS